MNRKWFLLICALLLAALSMPALAAEGDVLLHCGENEDAISEYIATACAVGIVAISPMPLPPYATSKSSSFST